jgi:hypothetical protein
LEVINNLKYQAVTDSSLSVFAWKDFNGQPIIAYWKDDEIPEDKDSFFNINLEVNGLNFTEPVLLNPYNGEVKAIPKRAIVKENNRVVFSGIPAWDSPYIILEKGLVEVETSF